MTDTKTLNRDMPTANPSEKAAEPKRLLDLSASQLTGGALAAMTSAVIGAQLGVAGTIAGAAVGSIVAGVAGSLYTASLKHTKEKISSVIVGRVGDTKIDVATVSDDTAVRDGWTWDAPPTQAMSTQPMAAAAPPSPDPVVADLVVDERGKPTRQLPWKGILVSAAVVFLLAIAGITGFELISGQAISGGQGTTVSQVSEGRSGGSDTPSQAPSSTPSSESSAEPSSSPSGAASTEPTSEPSSEPSIGETQTTEPTQSSEPSSSSEPTTSGTATADSGDQSAADTGDNGAVNGR